MHHPVAAADASVALLPPSGNVLMEPLEAEESVSWQMSVCHSVGLVAWPIRRSSSSISLWLHSHLTMDGAGEVSQQTSPVICIIMVGFALPWAGNPTFSLGAVIGNVFCSDKVIINVWRCRNELVKLWCAIREESLWKIEQSQTCLAHYLKDQLVFLDSINYICTLTKLNCLTSLNWMDESQLFKSGSDSRSHLELVLYLNHGQCL